MANNFGWPIATPRPLAPTSLRLADDVASVAHRWVAAAYDDLHRAGPERADQVRHLLDGYVIPWFGPQTVTVADISYAMTHQWLLALAGRGRVVADEPPMATAPSLAGSGASGAPPSDRPLSLRQAAEVGQVSLSTARRRWRDGQLPGAYRDAHGHVRVPASGAVVLGAPKPAEPARPAVSPGLSRLVIVDALWILRQVLGYSRANGLVPPGFIPLRDWWHRLRTLPFGGVANRGPNRAHWTSANAPGSPPICIRSTSWCCGCNG